MTGIVIRDPMLIMMLEKQADKYRVYSREALLIELSRLMGRHEVCGGDELNWGIVDVATALAVTEELTRKMRGGIPHVLAVWSAEIESSVRGL